MAEWEKSRANTLPDAPRIPGTVGKYMKRLKREKYILLIIIALVIYMLFITGLLGMKVHTYTNLLGIGQEFILFGLTLVGVAIIHRHTMWVAFEGGDYDWGLLAYAVGFGGSMVWLGSSAGVALSNLFPELRSVGAYLRSGWYIILSNIAGFLLPLLMHGWKP